METTRLLSSISVVVCCVCMFAACDQEYPLPGADVTLDTAVDTSVDTTPSDTAPDTTVDTTPDTTVDTTPDTAPDTTTAYPDGPYGWTPGMVWGDTTGEWNASVADVINNICLPSAAGTTVCLGDFYRSSSIELIWLDFTTTGCPYCDYAAQAEADFLAHMASYGYPSIWISVIGTTQSEAQSWATGFGLDPNTVLYDTAGWWGQGVVSGTPTVYLIHTSNMLIWDRADGWVPTTGTDYTEFKAWWADGSSGLIDMLQTAPGAVTP